MDYTQGKNLLPKVVPAPRLELKSGNLILMNRLVPTPGLEPGTGREKSLNKLRIALEQASIDLKAGKYETSKILIEKMLEVIS